MKAHAEADAAHAEAIEALIAAIKKIIPHWHAEVVRPPRYHLHESVVQRAVTLAARRAGLTKRVTSHTFPIRLRPICWRTDRTFEPCRSYWVIGM